MRRRRRKHCPHIDVVGVYGDEITRTPGGMRNLCRDCGRYLDGPVAISVIRQMEKHMYADVIPGE